MSRVLRLLVALGVVAAALGCGASSVGAADDETSLNWGGYYVPNPTGRFITQVSGTMVTPKPNALVPLESGSWVGVGGANTSDLIQAGVAFGKNGYYAWYELLPEHVTPIHDCIGSAACSVTFGDRIDVDIRFLGGDSWQIYLTNIGKWAWHRVVHYKSTFSSAEWIYEAPSTAYLGIFPFYGLPASHPGAVFLKPRFAVNGYEQSPAQATAIRIHTTPVGIVNISTTSDMNSSGAFAVCPYRQACPAP